jgi:hypothetical protein
MQKLKAFPDLESDVAHFHEIHFTLLRALAQCLAQHLHDDHVRRTLRAVFLL